MQDASLNFQINALVARYVQENPDLDLDDIRNEMADAAEDAKAIYAREHESMGDIYGARIDAAWEAAQ